MELFVKSATLIKRKESHIENLWVKLPIWVTNGDGEVLRPVGGVQGVKGVLAAEREPDGRLYMHNIHRYASLNSVFDIM